MIQNADLPHLLTAVMLGVTFLVINTVYHANAGLAKFGGTGLARSFPFTLLITHVLCAMICFALIPVTVFVALSGRLQAHARIARWTLPLWLFVSVSGLMIYIMAVHIYPWSGVLGAAK
ncbi:MAG: DUF420 domain-containing protein [bacterium]|nr:DUF420 domain-containing protein [bacterium]